MDEIRRESLPDSPGTGTSPRSQRKGPAEQAVVDRQGLLDRPSAGLAEPGEEYIPDCPAQDAEARERVCEPCLAAEVDFAAELSLAEEVSADAEQGQTWDQDPEMSDAGPESKKTVQAKAEELGGILCALLLSSRGSLGILRMAQACNVSQKAIGQGLAELRQMLETAKLPLQLQISGEQAELLTTPEVYPFLLNLKEQKKAEKLSAAALETLAVVAYRQPVMRAEIEAIRGVKAGPILRTLLDHRLIKVVGRADVPGRPLQYGTTPRFLQRFGLGSLKDLPSVKEFRSLG